MQQRKNKISKFMIIEKAKNDRTTQKSIYQYLCIYSKSEKRGFYFLKIHDVAIGMERDVLVTSAAAAAAATNLSMKMAGFYALSSIQPLHGEEDSRLDWPARWPNTTYHSERQASKSSP